MDIDNIRRKSGGRGPKVNVNIKISQEASNWLKKNNYSPTGIFLEAMKELGYDEKAVKAEESRDIDAETEQIEEIEKELNGSEDSHPQTYEAQQDAKL